MKNFKLIILFLFLIILFSFSLIVSNDYVLINNIPFLLSISTISCLFIINETRKKFEETFMEISVFKITFKIFWINFYQFALLFLIPLIISFSFLLSLELKLFTMLFSVCFLQNLLIVSLYKLFYSKIKLNTFKLISSLLIFSIAISESFDIEGIISFNPLLTLSYVPYMFEYSLLPVNVLLSFLLIYSVIYLLNLFVDKSNIFASKSSKC